MLDRPTPAAAAISARDRPASFAAVSMDVQEMPASGLEMDDNSRWRVVFTKDDRERLAEMALSAAG
jgi:hypothetical protein